MFVAVYQKALSLLYVEALLQRVKSEFEVVYSADLAEYAEFEDTFRKVLKQCETKADNSKRKPLTLKARLHSSNGQTTATDGLQEKKEDEEDETRHSGDSGDNRTGSSDEDSAFDVGKLKKKGVRGSKGRQRNSKEKKPTPAAKKEKENRVWAETSDVKKLDYSVKASNGVTEAEAVDLTVTSRMEESEESDEDFDEEVQKKSSTGVLSSFFRGLSVNVMGSNALTREDFDAALQNMKRKLMERNVAQDIAERLCESVAKNLEGQKLSGFTGVSKTVSSAFSESLERILTPKKTINILAEINQARSRTKPYVMVFVGVNGVGKSTNLAKVAYWLLQNRKKVMIAACDTFRAGAVEQLRTHCQRLKIPLFERGYEKDPAKVAFEATREAQAQSCDVLLVDTAGRMQDNEPLMRALSNLINLNEPDLVLFVGEALVGNDAVDQLTKFNQRLADLSRNVRPRLIDGIVLTKFDTIDDKVGAACSMVYTSGAPIVFVGCGQTYVDLKPLHVKSVVKSLLK